MSDKRHGNGIGYVAKTTRKRRGVMSINGMKTAWITPQNRRKSGGIHADNRHETSMDSHLRTGMKQVWRLAGRLQRDRYRHETTKAKSFELIFHEVDSPRASVIGRLDPGR